MHFRSLWRKGREWVGGNETGGGINWESSAVVQVRGEESLNQVAPSKWGRELSERKIQEQLTPHQLWESQGARRDE